VVSHDSTGVGYAAHGGHITAAMAKVPFLKMHGLGNDFVVLDARHEVIALGGEAVRCLADRHTGIGCDQLIVLEPPHEAIARLFMRIHNADGSSAEACGNAARCVAWLLHRQNGETRMRIETTAGLLEAEIMPDGQVAVDMGLARTEWGEIPLAHPEDTLCVDLALGPLSEPVCTNIGNPHATFFVEDVEAVDLGEVGPILERHPLFPERANIGVAKVDDQIHLRLRVWERGAGITRACGTAACAALVAAFRRGLTGRQGLIELDGGHLDICWREDGHVIMTGPAALSFEGTFDQALLTRS
jgi:diaminopimelate epimerase